MLSMTHPLAGMDDTGGRGASRPIGPGDEHNAWILSRTGTVRYHPDRTSGDPYCEVNA